jgi:2-keto-4-pentenoate hydratase/2-oxohepta-3-ene-1,7-dioic acid hydratase in catechol pathway
MKLLSFEKNNTVSFGVMTEKGIVDLATNLPEQIVDLKALLEKNLSLAELNDIVANCKEFIDPDSVNFLPVIQNPGAIFCMGMNTKSHVKEVAKVSGRDKHPVKPMLFQRTARTQVGHEQALEKPNSSPLLDYEGEIAIIIGKFGRHIRQEDALDYVAGYSCYNDASIRDYQLHSAMFTAGKNFPRTGGFGPWMVTADEIPDPEKLVLSTRVNGELVQSMTYDDLIFDFKEIISYVSEFSELHPGDVIVTGSAAGVGLFSQPQRWLQDGDIVTVEVTGIGTLSNSVAHAAGVNKAPVTRDNAEEVFHEALAFARNH